MIDRGVLIEAMRNREIREGLTERIVKELCEIKSRVRVEGMEGESFWTTRRVRQGCPLNPILFNILLADLEKEMERVKSRGVRLGEGRVYTLSYADDIVLLAESEDEMKSMMERLEVYLEEKNLELNTEKTKIMRIKREPGKLEKRDWRWSKRKIKEVKEIEYLGYVMQRNRRQEAHIRENVRRAAMAMRQVWRIGKKWFGKNWGRRIVIQQASLDSNGIRDEDMGVKEERGDGKIRRKLFGVDFRSR